jgi:hypothetical protein
MGKSFRDEGWVKLKAEPVSSLLPPDFPLLRAHRVVRPIRTALCNGFNIRPLIRLIYKLSQSYPGKPRQPKLFLPKSRNNGPRKVPRP